LARRPFGEVARRDVAMEARAAEQTHPTVLKRASRMSFGFADRPRADWEALHRFVWHVEALGFDGF
jgi:hypothetical protein